MYIYKILYLKTARHTFKFTWISYQDTLSHKTNLNRFSMD